METRAITTPATRTITPLEAGHRGAAGSARSSRSAWIEYALLAPAVLTVFVAHGLGGATSAQAGLILIAAMSAAGVTVWRGTLGRSLDYRPLYAAAVCFVALLAFVVWTAWAPSSRLLQGPLAALVGSSRVAIAPDQTQLELIKLVGLAAAVICGFQIGSEALQARRAVNLILALGLAWTLAALGGFLINGQARLSGLFVSPNTAGCLLLCLFLLALGRAARPLTQQRGRPLDKAIRAAPYAAYAALLALCLSLTASRSALALAVALGPLLVGARFWRARPEKQAWIAGAGVVGGVGLALLAFATDRTVLSRLADTSLDAADRWAIWSAYGSAFLQSPLYGFGLGSAPVLAKMSVTPDTYDALWNIRAVHNVYLQWLVEGGIIGAVLMFATLACLLAVTVKGATRGAFQSLVPFLAVDLVFLMQGLVDYPLQIPSVAMMWALLLGLQTGIAVGPDQKRGPEAAT